MKDLRLPAKQADQRKEASLQQDCMQWLKKELYNRGLPQIAYHIANERKSTPQHGMRLKLQGVLKGVSDVCLPMRSGDFAGVYCELKTKAGCPSQDQKNFLDGVEAEGYLAVVVNDFDTFKSVFAEYLDNRKQTK